MAAARPKLYLIDGSGYIYRAYYAVRPLSTRAGVPTNAVFGFARMLMKLLREEKPEYLGVAFDARQKTFRHQIFEQYKATRDSAPEDLLPQIPLIQELVEALDIPKLIAPGFEADDIIATLADRAVHAGYDVVMVSGDKDLMQLVSEHVSMLDTLKEKRYDRAAVIERFGVPPEKVVEVQGLAGDSSDNIPGVRGVGPKSAAKVIETYGDIEAAIVGLAKVEKPKAYEKAIVEQAEMARLSRRLVELSRDVPVPFEAEALRYGAPRREKLAPFLQKVEAAALLRDFGLGDVSAVAPEPLEAPAVGNPTGSADARPRVLGSPLGAHTPRPAGAPSAQGDLFAPAQGPTTASTIDRGTYRTILARADLEAFVAAARRNKKLAVDLETTSLDANAAEIVGFALATPAQPPAYVPVAHRYLGVPKQLPRAEVLDVLRPVLEDAQIAKVGQNIKYDMVVLLRAGVSLAGIAEDSMLAAYVLDPARASYSLDSLAREILAHDTIRYDDVTGTGKQRINFEEVDVPRATAYAAEDADVALRLCDVLPRRLVGLGLEDLYRKVELPLVPVLARMERTGIKVDMERLGKLELEFGNRLIEIEKSAQALAGETVNLASPKQLGQLFFEKLGYPVLKKTKTGPSTDQEVLEELSQTYELPKVVLEHRLLSKLKSTYVDQLQRMVNIDTGRVHTSYNQTGTATGRLSSSDPNLQNIPVRSEDGRRIRAAFIAEPGHLLVSADYSQIELRVMAHLSQDPSFIEAFRNGEDIHERTAREILTHGQPADAEARRRAKAINFGILYGLSEFGLSRQLGIPRGEAHDYIARYFSRYPGIRTFLDRTIEDARQTGYVQTLLGRRRYLPDLNSKNRVARQAAERVAMNTPIQGSAADLIKLAMLRVDALIESRRLGARLLLQVHDELVLEASEAQRDETLELVRREMAEVMPLAVPLVVDTGWGKSWAEAH